METTPFQIITVEENASESVESLGSKEKFWFQHDTLGRCLLKLARPNTGEDWSEKVAEQLALLLCLPCARYELGICDSKRGVVSPTIVPEDASLILGNQLLVEQESNYPRLDTVPNYRISQHTIDTVFNNLKTSSADLPPDWSPPSGIQYVQDLFVGYLLLDAWIGNTDRHHENWAIIERVIASPERSVKRYLAPTYDHASSLGCHLRDSEREERLTTKDQGRTVEVYVNRATSAFYQRKEDTKPLKTVDTFRIAAQRVPLAARIWLERLANVEPDTLDVLFRRLPNDRITPPAGEFARRMLNINRDRLLALREEFK